MMEKDIKHDGSIKKVLEYLYGSKNYEICLVVIIQ